MPWNSHWVGVADFLAMGGYASYVWISIGACALAVLIESLQLRRRHRAAARRVSQLRGEA